MNASSPPQSPAEPFEDYDDGYAEALPVRPRAQYLTPVTALLMALILGGVGFYVGIRVEKSDTAGGSGASAFARNFAAATGSSGSSSKASGSSRTGFSGGAGLASRFAGAFGGAGGGTIGSVSSVDGNTIYVKETSGNTVKVKLSRATTISKRESVSRKKLYPGDQVVIAGSATSNGTVQATAVTDSGSGTSGSGGATSSSSANSSSTTGSSSNAASAIKALFGGG